MCGKIITVLCQHLYYFKERYNNNWPSSSFVQRAMNNKAILNALNSWWIFNGDTLKRFSPLSHKLSLKCLQRANRWINMLILQRYLSVTWIVTIYMIQYIHIISKTKFWVRFPWKSAVRNLLRRSSAHTDLKTNYKREIYNLKLIYFTLNCAWLLFTFQTHS